MSRKHPSNAPRKSRRPRRNPPGAQPGIISPDPASPRPSIRATVYEREAHREFAVTAEQELPAFGQSGPVVWVDVEGLGDAEWIRALGRHFGLHHLALEDVVNTHQRPKLEPYDDLYFLVTRMPHRADGMHTEQLSLFLGPGFVLTFQEFPGDCLEPVRKRLRDPHSRLRREGADFLAYSLLDAIVDDYFPYLDHISDELDKLEPESLERPIPDTPARIHRLRRDLLTIRRAVAPLREAINALIRDGSDSVSEYTRLHLRDCHDHTYQILDLVDTHREIAAGLLDVHLSMVNNRMNEIMKVLTIIATLFIPLTFLAGVYGMNFDPETSPWNMPELGMRYGYPAVVVLMLAVIGAELLLFWRLGWLSRERR